jgi:tetratricopeptide (TPR) repeat protein
MYLVLYIFLQVSFWENTIFTRTATANRLKQEAALFYRHRDYLSAMLKYRTLVNDLEVKEEEVILNMAHCYYNMEDTAKARIQYEKLLNSTHNKIKSVVYQQLGLLAFLRNEEEKALVFTKQALQTDPENEKARFNYEWLRSKNINEDPISIPPDPINNQTTENQSPTPQQSDGMPNESQLQKPKNIELSEEKANAILEAIQNEESRNSAKKRHNSTKKINPEKPDW